jgi:hypothetical protein
MASGWEVDNEGGADFSRVGLRGRADRGGWPFHACGEAGGDQRPHPEVSPQEAVTISVRDPKDSIVAGGAEKLRPSQKGFVLKPSASAPQHVPMITSPMQDQRSTELSHDEHLARG